MLLKCLFKNSYYNCDISLKHDIILGYLIKSQCTTHFPSLTICLKRHIQGLDFCFPLIGWLGMYLCHWIALRFEAEALFRRSSWWAQWLSGRYRFTCSACLPGEVWRLTRQQPHTFHPATRGPSGRHEKTHRPSALTHSYFRDGHGVSLIRDPTVQLPQRRAPL